MMRLRYEERNERTRESKKTFTTYDRNKTKKENTAKENERNIQVENKNKRGPDMY